MEANDVFEEWDYYSKKRKLHARDSNLDSIISNSKLKIVAITGIRRSGKSSLLMLLAQKLSSEGKTVRYVNMEDSRIKDEKEILDKVLKWCGENGFLLLDEITAVDGWDGWLARVHEILKGKLHIIVSSSRGNLIHPAKPLRGRILSFELYPLSFREFLSFKGIGAEKTVVGAGKIEKSFSEYLKFGGFPEPALVKEEIDKIRIIDSYFKDIVALDIAEVSGEDFGAVETFGRYVIQSPYFSASKCLNFFKSVGHKIGKEKILLLENYAQLAYLFFFVPIFSYNIKDSSQYPRKAYCGDSGFGYAISGRMDMGRIYENLAYIELRRRTQGRREICYWKNKEGLEADFVVKQGRNIDEIIQVVYEFEDEKTKKREINGLVESAKELNAKHCTILTKEVKGTKTVEGIKIKMIPLMEWLLLD